MEGHGEVGFGKELETVDRAFVECHFECGLARWGKAGYGAEGHGLM